MSHRLFVYCMLAAAVAGNAMAQASHAPKTRDGHPDLSGVCNGAANQRALAAGDKVGLLLSAREGTLVNFERDNSLLRRMDPNKPVYKPEFWEKVQKLDQSGNTEDPSYGCLPLGLPRMGPPMKILQTPDAMIFLYTGNPDTYRVIPMDGRTHTPLDQVHGTWRGGAL